MKRQLKARMVVPLSMAILLTFGRNGMLPFEEDTYTILDHSMNILVLIVAPCVIFFSGKLQNNIRSLIPLIILMLWVYLRVITSPIQWWPSLTSVITISLSILIASQIASNELRQVRHFMLILAGIFSIYCYFVAKSSLDLIFSSSLIISLSTGARGAFIGLFAGFFIFILNRFSFKMLMTIPFIGILVAISYQFILLYLPSTESRLDDGDSTEDRINILITLFNKDISLFGEGKGESYAHNIFVEFLYDYGAIGFILFCIFLFVSLNTAYQFTKKTKTDEPRWALSLFFLQLTAQLISLDIFYGSLWAALVLPFGFGFNTVGQLPSKN